MRHTKKAATYVLTLMILGSVSLPNSVRANTTVSDSVEETVREFFEEVPVMIEIARCESKFRQFGDDGLPLRGGWGGGMIGVFQIYESVHTASAMELGFDLATLEGNVGYAKHLYTAQGTSPWNSAKSCWGTVVLTNTTSEVDIEALQKKVVLLQKLVAQLEALLKQKGSV